MIDSCCGGWWDVMFMLWLVRGVFMLWFMTGQDIVAKPRLVTDWNYPWFIGDDERSRSCCCSYGELRGLVYIFVGEMLWLLRWVAHTVVFGKMSGSCCAWGDEWLMLLCLVRCCARGDEWLMLLCLARCSDCWEEWLILLGLGEMLWLLRGEFILLCLVRCCGCWEENSCCCAWWDVVVVERSGSCCCTWWDAGADPEGGAPL